MAKFWPAAAKVLKPGATVALWTHASLYCRRSPITKCTKAKRDTLNSDQVADPSTPNAGEVQRILSYLEDITLAPHVLQPNRVSRSLYATLPLPWDVGATGFERHSFLRQEWDVDGILSDGRDFFGGGEEQTLAGLHKSLGTASMVTRWRADHPELADTDQDCVVSAMNQVREAMGVERGKEGQAKLRTGSASVVLMIKRSA